MRPRRCLQTIAREPKQFIVSTNKACECNAKSRREEKAKARTPHARLPGSAPRATACDMLRAQVARARDRRWPLWAGRFLNPQPPRPRPPGRIWHAARSAAARARPGGVSRGTQRKQTNQRLLSVGRSAGLATRVRGAQRSPKPNSRSYDAAASAAGIPPAALAVRECARMRVRTVVEGRGNVTSGGSWRARGALRPLSALPLGIKSGRCAYAQRARHRSRAPAARWTRGRRRHLLLARETFPRDEAFQTFFFGYFRTKTFDEGADLL